jgi:hypothetical protein
MTSPFSMLSYDETSKSFRKYDSSRYSILNEPAIPLDDLIKLRLGMKKSNMIHEFDLVDYAIIYVCSSLARYLPFLWHSIVEGKEGHHFAGIKQAFRRFNLLKQRLETALVAPMAICDPLHILKRAELQKYSEDEIV